MTTFALQAVPEDAASWLALARRTEAAGFDALYSPDHPGSCAAPSVALAAAAAVTERIGLCAYVSNAGVREPIHLAVDAATLDVVSGGRARLGLGAGHTPAEWQAIGRQRPGVNERVDRCLAVAAATRALLAGDTVTVHEAGLDMHEADLAKPRPVQERIPLLLGTANTRMLRWAGEHADIVGLSGLGRTLEDGHRHEPRWLPGQIDHQIEQVTAGSAGRDTPPALEALVQIVAVTDDAEADAAPHAERLGMTVADVLAAPFVLIGTVAEIRAAIERHEKRWGITRYAVRKDAFDAIQSLGLLTASHTSP
ncbi:LLM class F420-dependent oxidoreductase [Actinoplanes capillaceus]|uniref:LLM class F420-dependent oxidoreductase n=1 Tax=Actinoplanes campanulatus TaxID=113559 RepID=A0ABQ3WTE9_9ACTN|nr:LLM class flavin-dependent oxidoreductase [Actinoplanes capillaceus]GID49436.1 LLM class F420-dependent oxidoreductase [Actinoplanes capillaceus]